MKKIHCAILLMAFTLLAVAAPQEYESLLDRGLACAGSSPDSSIILINQYLDRSGSSIDKDDRSRAYYGLALATFKLGVRERKASNYAKTIELFSEAVRYFEKSDSTADLADAYLSLATMYSAFNQYGRAIDCAQASAGLSITIGRNDILSDAYDELGSYYRDISDYRKSIEYYEKSLELCDSDGRFFNETITLASMSQLYRDLGNIAKAERCLDKIRNLLEHIPEEEKPRAYYQYYLCASSVYSSSGRYEEADKYIKSWYDVKLENGLGSPLLGYLAYMFRRTDCMLKLGRFQEMISLYEEMVSNQMVCGNGSYLAMVKLRYACSLGDAGRHSEAVGLMKELLSDTDSTVIVSAIPELYRNLSDEYVKIGDYENAMLYAESGLKWFSDNPDRLAEAQFLRNKLSYIYYKTGEYECVWSVYSDFVRIQKKKIREAFEVMTDQERESYWYSASLSLLDILQLTSKCPDGHTGDVYDMALFTKGLLLNSKKVVGSIVKESGDILAAQMYFEKERLLELSSSAAQEGRYYEADSLKWAADDVDRQVMNRIDYFGKVSRFLSDSYVDVKAALNRKDLAVEYMNSAVDSVDTYYAVLLRRGWDVPEFIRLGTRRQIDSLTCDMSLDGYYEGDTGSNLYDMLLAPVLQYAFPGDNIHFSPSGLLHLINVAALPLPEGGIVADKYNMDRVSSTRELIRKDSVGGRRSASIFGGLEYSVEWKPLRYSDVEVCDINDILKRDGSVEVTLYNGKKGSKKAFLEAVCRAESILHLSTHGYFMNDSLSASVDPMRRCGLVMSHTEEDDDVIYGDEISGFGLNGNELVVMSACQSAMGELTGDGVFGLQRAFKKAGAKSIVMSLWDMNDRTGAEFMSEFYRGMVMKKYQVEKAFANAVSKIRKKYPEPYYWAGFILLD